MTEDANDRTGDTGSNIPDDLSARLASDRQRTRADDLFRALSHRRRRLILYYLKNHEQTSLDNLAKWIAAIEAKTDESEVTSEQQETVAADLFHIHLSKLTDLKIIEYDHRSGDVRYRDPPESVEQLLQTASLVDFE